MSDERLRLESVDADSVAKVIEAIGGTERWREAVLEYARLSDYGRIQRIHIKQPQLAKVLRLLVEAIRERVEFAEGTNFQQLAARGLPKALIDHVEHMVETVAGTLRDDAVDEEEQEPKHAIHTRTRFTYRACYLAERGQKMCKFRILGVQDGQDRKLVLTVRRGRKLRPQIAALEGHEGIQIVPMGRLHTAINAELKGLWGK